MTEYMSFRLGALQVKAAVADLFSENFDRYYAVYYQKNSQSVLNSLCDKYGSDKGEIHAHGQPYPWPSHSYADFIERTFGHCRTGVKSVFECGLGTNNPKLPSSMGIHGRPGASLRVWRDYFPSAEIFGADIDRDILFSEERIKTFYCDQTNPESIRAMWGEMGAIEFDLMIDDGLHTFEAGVTLFEHSFHKLRSGGIYIIEDVNVPSLIAFRNYFSEKTLNYEIVNLYRRGLPLADNSLVVIRKPGAKVAG